MINLDSKAKKICKEINYENEKNISTLIEKKRSFLVYLLNNFNIKNVLKTNKSII